MKTLSKAYEAKYYEDTIYKLWERSKAFTPKIDPKKKPFTLAMPPPNATGTLHLGHATMLAIEDIMVRYKRMQGYATLWLPGTDHASIATQNKVEKILAEEGKTRYDLGRAVFLRRVKAFVKDSQDIIRKQIRKMGSSCDWSRERYTLDEGMSEAVREIFVRMYRDGLIYRGNRIVNWCPRCESTLADDEVVYKKVKDKFYYIKYGPVIIGTARPETKFLDKTIVVHPQDKRYKKLISKKFMVKWIYGEVEAHVIADKVADISLGTGAMTLTPAHSFVDFDLAQKYGLPVVQIIDEKGNLTEHAGEFAGKNANASRKAIVEKMRERGLIDHIDEHFEHNLSVCYRCDTAIEPLVSKQWFVSVNKPIISIPSGFSRSGSKKKTKNQDDLSQKKLSLKEYAIKVVKNGEIDILPENFRKTYYHWMENLRDWCISRQIWFGHQIPVYYCLKCRDKNGEPSVVVSSQNSKVCPKCRSKMNQDPDTLDTWYSSGQWTYATLGWPKKTRDLQYFHPTSVLETGYDILFFWVARMIIMTTYALHEVPFRTVYLHGLVRDKDGRKMSKSLGNGIDPLDMIAKYGADSVRLSLVLGATPGNDVRLYEEKIAGYRNFVNKIWNAARFALMNVSEEDFEFDQIDFKKLSTLDKWILSRTHKLIEETTRDLENFRFSDAGLMIYTFTWREYCDWYLECSKVQKNPQVLLYVLKVLLKLLHPFVPFVTETIWQSFEKKSLLIKEKWTQADTKHRFDEAERDMNVVFDLITAIRSMRAESKIEPSKKIEATIYAHKHFHILREKLEIIQRLAGLCKIHLQEKGEKLPESLSYFVDQIEIYLPFKGMIDRDKERKRLELEARNIRQYISSLKAKLSNKNFVQKAPSQVVAQEKQKFKLAQENLGKFEEQLFDL